MSTGQTREKTVSITALFCQREAIQRNETAGLRKKRGPASKKHRLSSPATTWLDAIVLRIGSIHFASMEYACLGKQTGTLLPHGNNDIHHGEKRPSHCEKKCAGSLRELVRDNRALFLFFFSPWHCSSFISTCIRAMGACAASACGELQGT